MNFVCQFMLLSTKVVKVLQKDLEKKLKFLMILKINNFTTKNLDLNNFISLSNINNQIKRLKINAKK